MHYGLKDMHGAKALSGDSQNTKLIYIQEDLCRNQPLGSISFANSYVKGHCFYCKS